MQLRVARLCLDCEELYVGESCPICASERYAFLSTWLPSEERRRWRRPAPAAGQQAPGVVGATRRFFGRLFGLSEPEPPTRTLRTRASDRAPNLDFGESKPAPKEPATQATDAVELSPPQV